jgi:hypothetical protein
MIIMKKVFCMVALVAISFVSVYAHGIICPNHQTVQTDTTKKGVKEMKKDTTTLKKDTTKVKM